MDLRKYAARGEWVAIDTHVSIDPARCPIHLNVGGINSSEVYFDYCILYRLSLNPSVYY
jgi:hypothetical protein